jgi:hypothetical protein
VWLPVATANYSGPTLELMKRRLFIAAIVLALLVLAALGLVLRPAK